MSDGAAQRRRATPGGCLSSQAVTPTDFAEQLSATHASCTVHRTSLRDETFRSAITRVEFDDLAFVDVAATRCSVHRGGRQLARDDSDVFGIQLLISGQEMVGHGRSSAHVRAGNVIVWDSTRPFTAEALSPLVKRTVIIPRERALASCPRLAGVAGSPLRGRASLVRLFTAFTDQLIHELPNLDAIGRRSAAAATFEFLRGLVGSSAYTAAVASRTALREAVELYIDEHLTYAGLSPESIAAAHGISLRTLYNLFEGESESIAARVRRRRLEGARAQLATTNPPSVTDVTFSWGFSDVAHFSRVFRRHFGEPPSAVRRSALSH
ncbi:helix-turn-helix domain-containing protein [Nocardia sp. CA-135398]|uniref:helix-turn-helix domain-containing protein n=1 Tax=Nocardia sp. CA-135398 TaxID=3239977 RepID=UPI003D991294